MRKMLAIAIAVILFGCDFKVPLVEAPALEIDKSLIGLWEATENGKQPERLLVLPLGTREYMVSYPAGAKDGLFARACLARCGEMTLVQLEWIGTAEGKLADDGDRRVYQVAKHSLENDKLEVRMLSTSLVDKEATSTAQLRKTIEKNRDHEDLFGEPTVFQRVKS
jgi:hypothetical protein